jgi:hypothetical protein
MNRPRSSRFRGRWGGTVPDGQTTPISVLVLVL